ncbi:hypothetical protein HELRODRAFT_66074 [Helobdella robusta]|uniref:SPRY domain-containing protein 7 n=1 Tax=Helobdella robusta TaxID=6412 RepID=T1FYG6_HELRO|nr:hypothetical protein HELRODRAFT_66074 [Helobdella robusta]ESO02084.1 hypothetical protein HELRODRAFT_66074 [Helobdella robusta]
MSCFCCSRWPYADSDSKIGRVRLTDLPSVQLDTNRTGQGVVLVKNSTRICGSGSALANTPIQQNKAYFEAKLQSAGVWGLGLANRNCNLQSSLQGADQNSWVLRQDGKIYHKNEERGKLSEQLPQEGDVLGFTYDHVDLKIFLNGKPTNLSFSGIKGTVYPLVYVDDGAIIDMIFSRFVHEPPDGYEEIMIEKSLL